MSPYGDCIQSQPDSTYCQDNKCYDCDISCSSCNGPSNNNCITCKAGTNRSLVGTQCLCNEGYYEDTSKTCSQCSSTCLTCSGPSDKECLTCKNYMYQNTCYDNPPSGTYCDPTTKQCNKCDQTCLACSGPSNNNCTQCDSSKGLSLTASNTCACPDNQFIDNQTGSVQCSNCNSLCKTCNGPNKNNCLSCLNYLFNSQCYDFQPPQTYCDSQKICHQCSLECNSCQDSKTCSDCLENFFLTSDNTCQQCYPNCLTCNGKNPNQCLTCQNALVLKTDKSCGCQPGYFVDSSNKSSIQYTCFQQQPNSTYCYNGKCYDCDSFCSSCNGPSNTNCTQCKVETYRILVGTQCLCKEGYYEDNNKNCQQYNCFQYQPKSTYCQDGKCQDCDSFCSSCNGPSNTNCTACKVETYRSLVGNQCQCKEGYYEDTNKSCQYYNCFQSQPKSTYCQDGKCQDCDSFCSSCNGPFNTNCTACKVETYRSLVGHQSLVGTQCLCNEGYYEDTSKTCQQCSTTCLTCSGPSDKECLTCKNYIYQNTCYDSPPSGTYCDPSTKQCNKCDQTCSACSGPNNNNCTQCDS
ncbi:hypothetical protein ABPG73_006115, partial [Tetrahymena malaccensis]